MATMTEEPTAVLARAESSPLPAFTGQQMVQALVAYKELQAALDKAMPDAIMELDGKPFRKKAYWRAVAVAFNLTVVPTEERYEERGTFDDDRPNFGYIVTYRASTASGRATAGDGACFAVEKARRFKCPHPEREGSTRTLHFPAESCPDFDPSFQWRALPGQSTDHNIRGHAHTRAYNRAVSNLVGFGEVSAEEILRDEHGGTETVDAAPPRPKVQPKAADGSVLVVEIKESKSKPGAVKTWTKWEVSFDDGTFGSTFDGPTAQAARDAKAAGRRVKPTLEQDGRYTNLTALALAGGPAPAPGPAKPAVQEGVIATDEAPHGPDTEPVGGPEKVLSTRAAKTPAGVPFWRIQTDKREYVTDMKGVWELAEQLRLAGTPAYVAFKVGQGTRGPYNQVTEFGESAVAGPPTEAF